MVILGQLREDVLQGMDGDGRGRTLASRDNEILSVFLEAGEADVGDRSRVAVAGQGQVLSSGAVRSHGNCEKDLKVMLLF